MLDLSFIPGAIHLVAIAPDAGTTSGYWFGLDLAAAAAWAETLNAQGCNIYWTANEVRPGLHAKPAKTDIVRRRVVHVDVDDSPDLDRILALQPSCVINSGNGLQAYWELVDDPGTEVVEDINRRLIAVLDGDPPCWNADRLLRVPGTLNYPTAVKLARGRRVVQASLVLPRNGLQYRSADLLAAWPEAPAPRSVEYSGVDLGPWAPLALEDLDPPLDAQTLALCQRELPPGQRSEHVSTCCAVLARQGYSNEQIMGLLMSPDNPGLSGTIYDQPDPERQAWRKVVLANSVREQHAQTISRAFSTPVETDHLAGFIPLDQGPPPSASVRRHESVLTLSPSDDEMETEPDPGTPIFKTANKLAPCVANVVFVILTTETLRHRISYDLMARQVMIGDEPATDDHITQIQIELQRSAWGLETIGAETVWSAISLVAKSRARHPVRQYLRSLTWDGVPRIDRWLTEYCGAEDTLFVRRVSRMVLIQAVARVFSPGCKADCMLILQGPQGVLKSSMLQALCGGPQWFSDRLPDLRNSSKDVSQHLRGKWIIEVAELHAMGKADERQLKAFLSTQIEKYRPPYGRTEVEEPRQCILIGTTNDSEYLSDPTGNRRYWPVYVPYCDAAGVQRDRDQLWAEALAAYRAGDKWYSSDSEFVAAHAVATGQVYSEDPWADIIQTWLDAPVGDDNRPRTRVELHEIAQAALRLPLGSYGAREKRRIYNVMTSTLKWKRLRSNGRTYYLRPG